VLADYPDDIVALRSVVAAESRLNDRDSALSGSQCYGEARVVKPFSCVAKRTSSAPAPRGVPASAEHRRHSKVRRGYWETASYNRIFSALFPHPTFQDRGLGLGQGRTPSLSSFPPTTPMCAGSERDILVPQRGHLGQSQSGLHGGDQKGMVTASQPLRSIRRRQQRLDLGPGQKTHQCAPLSLVRNRQHSLDGSAVRRRFQRGVTKKRPDGRQTEVPTSGA